MEDWTKQIGSILIISGNDVLYTAEQVSAKQAKEHAKRNLRCIVLYKTAYSKVTLINNT